MIKGQITNISGFISQITNISGYICLCLSCSPLLLDQERNHRQNISKRVDSVLVELHLPKQAIGWIWPGGYSLWIPDLKDFFKCLCI